MNQQLANLGERVAEAVSYSWKARERQSEKQKGLGRSDQGSRGAVTGGYQMLQFSQLITNLVKEAGVAQEHIFYARALELPGFFRPTKEWDLLVVRNGQLVAAIELKSQVGAPVVRQQLQQPHRRGDGHSARHLDGFQGRCL